MIDWLPIAVGISIIVLALGVARFAPDSAAGQELNRSYGIRATGPRGNRTRRDHLRSAGVAALLAALLESTSAVLARFGGNPLDESRGGMIAAVYTLGAFVLAAMAAVSMVGSLWKAAIWRVELPDTPEHRRGLANAIDKLLDGQVSSEERAAYLDVRYLQPQLEQVRRAVMKLANQSGAGVPEGIRSQIKQWTAGIRDSAGA